MIVDVDVDGISLRLHSFQFTLLHRARLEIIFNNSTSVVTWNWDCMRAEARCNNVLPSLPPQGDEMAFWARKPRPRG